MKTLPSHCTVIKLLQVLKANKKRYRVPYFDVDPLYSQSMSYHFAKY